MFGLAPRRREKLMERPLARRELSPFGFLREEFAPLFERMFGGLPMVFEPSEELTWGFETEDAGKEFIVRAELPGYEVGEIEVELSGNVLTIRAEHKEEIKEKEKETVERRWGKVVRTLTLPMEPEPEKIEARYHNGVLEVHLPKLPEAMPKKIAVKA